MGFKTRFGVESGISYYPLHGMWNKIIRRSYSEEETGSMHYVPKGIKVKGKWHIESLGFGKSHGANNAYS